MVAVFHSIKNQDQKVRHTFRLFEQVLFGCYVTSTEMSCCVMCEIFIIKNEQTAFSWTAKLLCFSNTF